MAPCCGCTRCLLSTQENMCAGWREGTCLRRALSWSPLSLQTLVSSHVGRGREVDRAGHHRRRLSAAAIAGPRGNTAHRASTSPVGPLPPPTPLSHPLETDTLPSVASIQGHPSSPDRVIFLPCGRRAEPGSELPCCRARSPPDLLVQARRQPPCPASGRRWGSKGRDHRALTAGE